MPLVFPVEILTLRAVVEAVCSSVLRISFLFVARVVYFSVVVVAVISALFFDYIS